MAKTLIDIVKKTVASVGLAGALMFNSGCVKVNQNEVDRNNDALRNSPYNMNRSNVMPQDFNQNGRNYENKSFNDDKIYPLRSLNNKKNYGSNPDKNDGLMMEEE